MEELIFFAVIIIFSIIESISRSRKKRARRAPQLPEDWEPDDAEEWSAGRGSSHPTVPTYDAEPSYDEIELDEAHETAASRESGSEGMVPADIWEEIAGLASGTRTRRHQREAPRPVRAPSGPTRVPSRSPRPAPRATHAQTVPPAPQRAVTHRVHLAHAGYGTDPSSRAPSEQDGLDPLARVLSADVAAVRKQLRRSGRHALRQVMILQEVLGPPASMRSEPFME